jgi:hypothetical protein
MTMPDATQGTKVYRDQNGDQLVVAAGGKIKVEAGGQINLLAPKGTIYFVDSVNGTTTGDGLSWDSALSTIAAAVALAVAGDVIMIKGSFSEAVTVSVAGLSIIGAGTTPKEAQWTAAADAVCLTIAAEHVLVENIYFRPPAYAASRATCAISLSGANHARIIGNRFQGKTGSQAAIYSPVCNSDNVWIVGNEFAYMNTATYGAGIVGVEAGGLSYSAWRIVDNVFSSCVTAINICGRVCQITGNTIGEYGINPAGALAQLLAMGIDLSGTSSGGNLVWGNQLGGTYGATLYVVGASGDQWAGNFNVLTGGLTAANPS